MNLQKKVISLPISNQQKKFTQQINSIVENYFITKNEKLVSYPSEKIKVVEIENPFELGKLTALRFIEWVIANPNGVISLPTGKTPEYFLKFLKYYKKNWHDPLIQKELKNLGINTTDFPDTRNLKFIQIDEFFPINPKQENSFNHYLKTYYFPLLNLKPENIHTINPYELPFIKNKNIDLDQLFFDTKKIDLTLFTREPKNDLEKMQKQVLEEINKYCEDYEQKIRDLGGIGFFLGGIGPDGHIAFNMQGSPFNSKTRLIQLNYPSSAASASDLGGMRVARDKTAITIGLDTIAYNKNATIIIIAAGEAKTEPVINAIEKPANSEYPASILQSHPNSRFYITKDIANKLQSREIENIKQIIDNSNQNPSFNIINEIIINLALQQKKKILDLTLTDFSKNEKAKLISPYIKKNLSVILEKVQKELISKINNGLEIPHGKQILHTSPHHDDIILSYLPTVKEYLNKNANEIIYLTSGFNSVSNHYIKNLIKKADDVFMKKYHEDIFSKTKEEILNLYKKAYLENNIEEESILETILFLQNLRDICNFKNKKELKTWIKSFFKEYLNKQYAGQKDIPLIQIIKGAIRESESSRKWAILGLENQSVHHLRLPFYTGDFFNPIPGDKDVNKILEYLDWNKPDIITVAFDPEGSGPDTHFKVLQALAQSLRNYQNEKKPEIIGYRNIWFKFAPSQANIFVPVSQESLDELEKIFLNCFSSQKNAEFPSPYYDGPFSGLAQKIQIEQFENLKILLGKDFFENNPDPRLKKAKGFVFLKSMNLDEFLTHATELEKRVVKI